MNIDRLDKCAFCLSPMVKNEKSFIECPRESEHPDAGKMWAWLEPNLQGESVIVAINIQYKGYQLHFNLKHQKTQLWHLSQVRIRDREYIANLPYLMDFPLDIITIDKKLKTFLTFW